jgi:hypothetical protein
LDLEIFLKALASGEDIAQSNGTVFREEVEQRWGLRDQDLDKASMRARWE